MSELRVEKLSSAAIGELRHSLLAVMHPALPPADQQPETDGALPPEQEDKLLLCNCAGFVYV